MSALFGYFVVFLGGGLGAAARHWVNRTAMNIVGPDYPAGTLAVNIVGSMAMGMLASWFAFRGETTTAPERLFLTTGVLGGFTTFSAFSNETMNLWREGESLLAAANVTAHLVLCFGAVWLSRALAFQIWK